MPGRRIPKDVRGQGRPGRGSALPQAGGGFPAAVGGAAALAPAGFSLQDPAIYRPPGATDFFQFANAAGLDAATSPVEPAGLIFTVPGNNVAVIRGVTLNVNNLLPSSDIVWQLLENGSPIQGWDALTIAPRTAASVSASFPPESTVVRVSDGAQLGMRLEVRDAGTYDVAASYNGWFYGKALADRYLSMFTAG